MCAGAISFARIRRLYYGAADPKGGAVDSGVRFFASPTCHHVPEVYSAVGERKAAALLRDFFKRGGDAPLILRSPLLRASRRMGRPPSSFETHRYAIAPQDEGSTVKPQKTPSVPSPSHPDSPRSGNDRHRPARRKHSSPNFSRCRAASPRRVRCRHRPTAPAPGS